MPVSETPKRGIRRNSPAPDKAEPASSAESAPDLETQSSPARVRRRFQLGDPLVAPFLICLFAGIIAEVVGQAWDLSFVVLFGPIFATAAYPLWGWYNGLLFKPSLRERLADNSYYLGFIFTQISLLIGFGGPALTGAKIGSSDVLRYFGVAVGASMTGLIFRTIIVQTGHSFNETTDIMHGEVENLSIQVTEMAKGVSAATLKILHDLDEVSSRFQESRVKVSTEVGEWTKSLGENLQSYDAVVKKHATITGESLGEVNRATGTLTNSLNSQGLMLGDKINSAASSIDQLRDELNRKLGAVGDQILAGASSILDATNAVRTSQGAATGAVDQVTKNILETVRMLDTGTAAMRALDALSGKIGLVEDKVDVAMDAGNRVMGDANDEMRRLKADLDLSLQSLVVTLGKFRQELDSVRG